MKLPSPNMLVCSRQSAKSISQQAIERSRLVFQNLLPYLSTLGTWTRAIDPPACGNDIENSICQDECGFIFSICSMACSRVQYPPGLAAESLGLLSCLLGFDAVSL
jgi:hypothetical protein